MSVDFDRLQAPSPRESMHSELLLTRNRHEIRPSLDSIGHVFDFAAWLKIKNSQDIPVLLLLEHEDFRGEMWYIVDSARVRNVKGTVLMSGRVEIKEKRLKSLNLYICHPNPDLKVEVEELRFNGELVRKDYIEAFNVA